MQDLVSDFEPDVVVMDPISDLLHSGGGEAVFQMLTRQVDYLKSRGVTAVFTSLNTLGDGDHSEQQVGSLIDTWLVVKLKLNESDETRHRVLYVLKSRGMAHSHEVRDFELGQDGLSVADRYLPATAS
jgi:circadian clock protein KaiC